MEINKLRDIVYNNAVKKGFYDKELSNEHYLCLVISELMEAVEADRKSKYAKEKHFKQFVKVIPDDKYFISNFNLYIKDTVEDELADAAIRLLSFAGYRNISIEEFSKDMINESAESCSDESFTESVYAIITTPIRFNYEYNYLFDKQINSMILNIFGLAKHLDIDLLWHIKQKIKYNEHREKMHGKKY